MQGLSQKKMKINVYMTCFITNNQDLDKNLFLLLPRNRLIYAGLEPILSHTDKSCSALFYRKFSTKV